MQQSTRQIVCFWYFGEVQISFQQSQHSYVRELDTFLNNDKLRPPLKFLVHEKIPASSSVLPSLRPLEDRVVIGRRKYIQGFKNSIQAELSHKKQVILPTVFKNISWSSTMYRERSGFGGCHILILVLCCFASQF